MARKKQTTDVRVKLPCPLPEGIEPTLHVYDTYGKYIAQSQLSEDGTGKVAIPAELEGATLRYVVGPQAGGEPSLKEVRRVKGVEKIRAFEPGREISIDIAEGIITDWILCRCTVRGKVVKSFPQPTGSPVDYPVCNARVHICEVDHIPNIVWRLPDDIIWRLRDDLIAGPFPEPFPRPLPGPQPDPPPIELRERIQAPASAPDVLLADLTAAPTTFEMRRALIDNLVLRWWCWYPYLDPFFNYDLDCWTVWTDESGCFDFTFFHSCNDTPDIYIWVDQFIAGSWKTLHARGPRCGTHWNYDCGSEITIRVTHPDAIVCQPPPEIDIPPGISTWVLPMAVGNLEIAGSDSHPADPLGWVQTDGTASYFGGPANIGPITDAPLGGFLQFKMLHSLNLPKIGLTRYLWSYRLKPADPTDTGGWTPMDETINRKYQVPGPGGFPKFPALALGPDPDGLFAFRPSSPPSGVWPVTGFTEDLWSAKLQTSPLDPDVYQIRVTVHDENGDVVKPKSPSDPSGLFDFVVTDERDAAKETYSTRAATDAEIIDDGFVFCALIDNGVCTSVLDPVQTSTGGVADSCGFLRYADKATTDVTLAFEASHPRDEAWFVLDLFRGQTDLDQVEVEKGGEVGALSVGVDTNGGLVWPNAFYNGDGAGNFSGTFSAARFLELCDNAAFGVNLWTRAKAHNGISRLNGHDSFTSMAFALAQEEEE